MFVQWLKTWQLGVKSLLLHPMRSMLTVLGIFIGVASVIWLLAIGEGISIKAREQIEGLGAENIIVRSRKPTDEENTSFSDPPPFGVTRQEFKILRDIPTITSALQIRELPYKFSYAGNPNIKPVEGRLVGCTPEYAEVTRLEIDRGQFILENNATDCVLAAKLSQTLFPFEDPIGKQIYLPESQDFYRIVGVLKHRSATAAIGGSLAAQDFSGDVYIPIKTMRQRMGDKVIKRGTGSISVQNFELTQVTLRVDDPDNVPRTAELVQATLNYGLEEEREDVTLTVPYELLEQARTTRLMFMLFMGLIAAISLLVGGIGIMNIMLATVTERTREIGIRRALGAKRSDIIRQFLIETIALSIVGGLTGVIGGLLCPFLLSTLKTFVGWVSPRMIDNLPEVIQDTVPVIVPISIPLAFGISVIVGVIFGIYPAMRAAKMDPIEALRHE